MNTRYPGLCPLSGYVPALIIKWKKISIYRKSFLQVNQEYIVGILREIFIIVHSNARISSCKHQDHPTALRYTELKFDWLSNRLGQSHSFSERASWRQLGRGKPTSRKLSMEESAE